jgi:membrane protein YqaA with SNARE-associated domain
MIAVHIVTAVTPASARRVRRWLFRLGGLGLLDNSPVPLPGIMDVATLVLSARQS